MQFGTYVIYFKLYKTNLNRLPNHTKQTLIVFPCNCIPLSWLIARVAASSSEYLYNEYNELIFNFTNPKS